MVEKTGAGEHPGWRFCGLRMKHQSPQELSVPGTGDADESEVWDQTVHRFCHSTVEAWTCFLIFWSFLSVK